MSSPVSPQYQELYGCKFIDVGRTPPAEYLQPAPATVGVARTVSAVVEKIIPGASSSVAIVRAKGEEIYAVIDAGCEPPKVGMQVSVKTQNGASRVLKK